jgi:hypothetical protein
MRRLLIAAAVAALALPAGASASTLRGTVVHRVSHAHSFVIATRSGTLRAVHSHRHPALGRDVSVRARRLSDGTYSARSVATRRHTRRHAKLRGVVTHVDRAHEAFVLSGQGTSIVVHDAQAPTTMPAVGQNATVDVTLTNDDELEADDVQTDGQAATFELEGIVKAVDQAAQTVTVTADDDDQLGGDLVVTFPAGSDLSGLVAGQEIELRVTKNADGTFSAVSAAGDDEQGDDAGEGDHQGGDHHGGDQHSGDQQSGGGDHGDGGAAGGDGGGGED